MFLSFALQYFSCHILTNIQKNSNSIQYLRIIFLIQGGGWAWVRRQENSSFANFGRALACAVCKCAVLCVGCSLYRFFFFCLYAANVRCVVFLGLLVTDSGINSCGS